VIGSRLVIAAVRLYQRLVSPWLLPRCRYWPTCSEYARLAIERRGVLSGSVSALGRLLRCHPLGGGGIDLPR
jgi:uncharacterized protein